MTTIGEGIWANALEVITKQEDVKRLIESRIRTWTPVQWRKRWAQCHPATYPPELWSEEEHCYTRWEWIGLLPERMTTVYYTVVCRRCGEGLELAHVCPDLAEAWLKSDLDGGLS